MPKKLIQFLADLAIILGMICVLIACLYLMGFFR